MKAALVLRHLGPRWIVFRLCYALRRRSGALERRCPAEPWPSGAGSFSQRGRLGGAPRDIGAGCIVEADAVLAGSFRLFSWHQTSAGFPPAWNGNPLTHQAAPPDRHWSRLGDFAFGDIKGIWELNRFAWAFALGRAFARTGDNRYAEGFWTLFEDWMGQNPPNLGPAWMCGQEATFRLIAVVFARNALADAAATTSERLQCYQQFVLGTGRRIAANLDYALSQSNNHGVSECIGLFSAGLLEPDAPDALAWQRRGRSELKRQLETLVYDDGAFAQHSVVYHRVLLQDLLWMVTLMRAYDQTVPEWLLVVGRRALAFVVALMNPRTGRVPLYGANDGSNILPLADADYLDFRPTAQAGYAVFHGERGLPAGQWDEAADWLAGFAWRYADGGLSNRVWATNKEVPRHFPHGGVLVWRQGDLQLFFRCPTRFRHRPSQADLLHIDIEWRGQSIAIDAGSYSYNSPGRFAGSLKEAAVHNTVTFDGGEPMTKAGRFLYLPWPKGRAAWREQGKEFEASHNGWKKNRAHHLRRVRTLESGFEVEDLLTAKVRTRARLHWLLADGEQQLDISTATLRLATPAGCFSLSWKVSANARVTLVRADPHSDRGWASPYYGETVPALSLAIEFEFSGEAQVATTFRPVSQSSSVLGELHSA